METRNKENNTMQNRNAIINLVKSLIFYWRSIKKLNRNNKKINKLLILIGFKFDLIVLFLYSLFSIVLIINYIKIT